MICQACLQQTQEMLLVQVRPANTPLEVNKFRCTVSALKVVVPASVSCM